MCISTNARVVMKLLSPRMDAVACIVHMERWIAQAFRKVMEIIVAK